MDILVQCFQCGKKFYRKQSRVNNTLKVGGRLFCSLSCNRKQQNKERTDYSCFRDEYSPFRYHFKNLNKRNRHTVDITIENIKLQWEKQKGICPYSGRKMNLHPTTNKRSKLTPNTASLDRIDSSKGYTIDNIQWVCVIAQYAKNIFSSNDLYEFCFDVTETQRTRRDLNPRSLA